MTPGLYSHTTPAKGEFGMVPLCFADRSALIHECERTDEISKGKSPLKMVVIDDLPRHRFNPKGENHRNPWFPSLPFHVGWNASFGQLVQILVTLCHLCMQDEYVRLELL